MPVGMQDPVIRSQLEAEASSLPLSPTWRESPLAKKTIRVSDQSGQEIEDGKGATVRITFRDARKGVRELDVTDAEAERLGGRAVARRGRRPGARAKTQQQ
jgi:hypothetical protein